MAYPQPEEKALVKDKLGSISGLLLCCVGIAVAAGVPPAAPVRPAADGPASGRRVVRKAADLPPFTYLLIGTAQALLDSDDATFNAFAGKVRNDLESVLRDDDVQDKSVLLHLLSDRLDLQMLAGNDVDALKTCEQMRLLSDQPAMKATGMFNDITFLKARMTTGHSAGKAFQAEYEKNFRAHVDSLPWEVVAERIKKRRADFERLSVEYVASKVRADIEPFVSEHHALDFPMATRLIFWRGVLLTELPQRQIVLDVLSTYIKDHDAAEAFDEKARFHSASALVDRVVVDLVASDSERLSCCGGAAE